MRWQCSWGSSYILWFFASKNKGRIWDPCAFVTGLRPACCVAVGNYSDVSPWAFPFFRNVICEDDTSFLIFQIRQKKNAT